MIKLEEIVPYLPYDLRIMYDESEGDNHRFTMVVGDIPSIISFDKIKPMLIPLSELNEDNADFLSGDGYLLVCEDVVDVFTILNSFSYSDVTKLLSKHYDVFGLIEKGLAINKNDIKNE